MRRAEGIAEEFPGRDIKIINDDANVALPKWCAEMDTERKGQWHSWTRSAPPWNGQLSRQ